MPKDNLDAGFRFFFDPARLSAGRTTRFPSSSSSPASALAAGAVSGLSSSPASSTLMLFRRPDCLSGLRVTFANRGGSGAKKRRKKSVSRLSVPHKNQHRNFVRARRSSRAESTYRWTRLPLTAIQHHFPAHPGRRPLSRAACACSRTTSSRRVGTLACCSSGRSHLEVVARDRAESRVGGALVLERRQESGCYLICT